MLDLVQDRRRPSALEKAPRVGPNPTDQIRILQQVV
jgi:hypothetical protein